MGKNIASFTYLEKTNWTGVLEHDLICKSENKYSIYMLLNFWTGPNIKIIKSQSWNWTSISLGGWKADFEDVSSCLIPLSEGKTEYTWMNMHYEKRRD